MNQFYETKIKQPILNVIKEGVSPEKISLSISCGVTGGIFPIPGLTTIPVLIAVYIFKLNPVLSLLINYLCTPLNLASAPLFMYYGNTYLGKESDAESFSSSVFMEALKTDLLKAFITFQNVILNGILAWAFFCPMVTILLYLVFLPFFQKLVKTYGPNKKQIKDK